MAVVLEYLDHVKKKIEVPKATEKDQRLVLLEGKEEEDAASGSQRSIIRIRLCEVEPQDRPRSYERPRLRLRRCQRGRLGAYP